MLSREDESGFPVGPLPTPKDSARNYLAEYETALKVEGEKRSYIDYMHPDELRAEMRALIQMLEAERKMTTELQKLLERLT